MELKLVLFACGEWHDGSLSEFFRRQMTVIETVITDLNGELCMLTGGLAVDVETQCVRRALSLTAATHSTSCY